MGFLPALGSFEDWNLSLESYGVAIWVWIYVLDLGLGSLGSDEFGV